MQVTEFLIEKIINFELVMFNKTYKIILIIIIMCLNLIMLIFS